MLRKIFLWIISVICIIICFYFIILPPDYTVGNVWQLALWQIVILVLYFLLFKEWKMEQNEKMH